MYVFFHILSQAVVRYSFTECLLSIGIDKIRERNYALIVFTTRAKSIPPVHNNDTKRANVIHSA
jgi:hypothetical protein